MNKLWTFGCSFTYNTGCNPGEKYYEKFKKDEDKTWTELVAEYYGMELENFGIDAASNDVIFDTIIDQFQNIKKEDLVVIEMTLPHRYDIPYGNRFLSVFNQFLETADDNILSFYSQEQLETIVNFHYYFSYNDLYKKRQIKRFNFVINLLKEKGIKVCFWKLLEETEKKFERIHTATQNVIRDGHFSYKGHEDFAKYIISKLELKKNII